ncbi:MAG: hypothetical protein AAFX40_17460 [Cyanobacteria bacterium J06639_1]
MRITPMLKLSSLEIVTLCCVSSVAGALLITPEYLDIASDRAASVLEVMPLFSNVESDRNFLTRD